MRLVDAAHAACALQGLGYGGRVSVPALAGELGHAAAHKLPALRAPGPAAVEIRAQDGNHQRVGRQGLRQCAQVPGVDQPNIASGHRTGLRQREAQGLGRLGQQHRFRRWHAFQLSCPSGSGCARQLARQFVKGFVGLVDHAAGAVPGHGRITRHVVGIKKVGFAAARARHPLPAEVVAGQITVEQVPTNQSAPARQCTLRTCTT